MQLCPGSRLPSVVRYNGTSSNGTSTERRSSMSRAVGEGKMDILVVEDDPVIGKAVQKGLSEAGHECTWVKDGKEGLELAMSQKHDVVVLDLLLPGESGLSLLETLRGAG